MRFWIKELVIFLIVVTFIALIVNCEKKKEVKLSQKDIEFARCACEREKKELKWVQRNSDRYIDFKCIGDTEQYIHYESTYTEGCSK